ncbi:DNA-3-methyladenine glycosylase family protein [Archaeoglobus neptunius]|uniref:DNA-3-methyladenine glycosylase family protein n=1 Tax=Archaeoglobus neptunius TaxID=2798580 RepID=UPI00192735EF|nr:DNA-3-methyladenine glycosylase [Archaeoglobus neptunius]
MWKIRLDHPVNWKLKLKFFVLPDSPTPDMVFDGKWVRALRVKDEIVPLVIYPESSNVLVVDTSEVSEGEKKVVERKIVDYFGLHDPSGLYSFMDGDEKLKFLKERFYGFGRAGLMSMSVYEGVIKAVIQQQISFRVAEKITARIVERFGERSEHRGFVAYEFPDPESLGSAGVEDLRDCGLSRRKAEVIIDISETATSFDFEMLRKAREEEVYEFLTSFRGIGRWTAELVMSMAIGMNVFPADDLGVRRAVSNLYFDGELKSIEEVRKLAKEKFGNYARDVLFYLFLYDRS